LKYFICGIILTFVIKLLYAGAYASSTPEKPRHLEPYMHRIPTQVHASLRRENPPTQASRASIAVCLVCSGSIALLCLQVRLAGGVPAMYVLVEWAPQPQLHIPHTQLGGIR
jgi:hypothetical protein